MLLLGLDVLNKTTILWRQIATKLGMSFFDYDVKHESFIDLAIEKYKQKTGKAFDTSGLNELRRDDPEDRRKLTERMSLLDEAFAELRQDLGSEHVFRYVGEITYDEKSNRYSLYVGLKRVHKEDPLAKLEGTENMVLFGIDGHPSRAYGIEPGPGAGVPQTADAIMHDLEQIDSIVRGRSSIKEVAYHEYAPVRKPKGERWQPIKWLWPDGPSARAVKLLRR